VVDVVVHVVVYVQIARVRRLNSRREMTIIRTLLRTSLWLVGEGKTSGEWTCNVVPARLK
jgi:hypothetical protein